MAFALFGPLTRQLPPVGTDLGPLHASDLAAPLAGHQSHLVDRSERITELVECGPRSPYLLCRDFSRAPSLGLGRSIRIAGDDSINSSFRAQLKIFVISDSSRFAMTGAVRAFTRKSSLISPRVISQIGRSCHSLR